MPAGLVRRALPHAVAGGAAVPRPHRRPRAPPLRPMSWLRRTLPVCHGHDDPDAERVRIRWKDGKSGEVMERTAAVGSTLLEAAHRTHVDLEGACEGSVACSTCHVILEGDVFDALEEATEEEDDMLDMAFGLTETSRLACQCRVTVDMDNTVVELPAATRNFYVDGHVPQPH